MEINATRRVYIIFLASESLGIEHRKPIMFQIVLFLV